jgi:hypothetical protein
MEEGEKEATQKANSLILKYQNQFFDISMTLHPCGRPGEIRGKSSNVAWAAKEMVRQSGGPRLEDIITVMDADTCFAADYFTAMSYHYAVASPRQRALMFFVPPTLFDRYCIEFNFRNADKVPFLVRVADMQWSMGVLSNLYPGAPFSPPCSAYSLPMKLAASVGLWDVDTTSIGEDFHMYIKTFFSTHGEVKIVPIYSPASCCNIEGSGFIGGLYARGVQAKRHLWGALDLGYTIRRALFGLFAPTFDSPQNVLQKIPFTTEHSRFDFHRLSAQLIPFTYRALEAHVFIGQVLLMMVICNNIIPLEDSTNIVWRFLSGGSAVHPYVILAQYVAYYIDQFAGIVYIGAVIYYEKYQYWCGVERWALASKKETRLESSQGQGVQHIGNRSRIQARRKWYNMAEWCVIPIVGMMFMVIPQVYVHISQLWTDSLSYVVAAKPVHDIQEEDVKFPSIQVVDKDIRPVFRIGSAPAAESFLVARPDFVDAKAHPDSGYFEYSGAPGETDQGQLSLSMWHIKGNLVNSPSIDSVGTMVN